jgi:small-conductance mechanosensitive channel
MNPLVDLLHRHTPLPSPVARLVVIVLVIAAAWVLARAAARVAVWLVAHGERAGGRSLARRKERETAISIVQTSARYVVWAVALALCFAASFGQSGMQAVIGASFLAIVIGFSVQRFLIDLLAGVVMFFEGWFRIGDAIRIEPWNVEGIVEEVSLRAVVIRGAGGELQRVHNSQVLAVKLYPRGYREAEIDLVVRDAARAREMIDDIVPLLPVEPTRFVRPLALVDLRELDSGLAAMRLRVAVVPGREWLAEDLLPALLKELGDELLVHGPVVSFVDEVAQRRFGRLAAVAAARQRQGDEEVARAS